ncbi:hypothetical protein GsuE55_30840 [Geobacillus subterraneus]|uniref:Uncharacterized protein n=1 Tax=Geobacillus subterraneus TaxID=129338 RepID=A0A679G2M3_9BACL|nr:hypothetical protein GsuE55_30840 [Geobacillus subterraneus]
MWNRWVVLKSSTAEADGCALFYRFWETVHRIFARYAYANSDRFLSEKGGREKRDGEHFS